MALTNDQKTSNLFKKSQGVAETNTSRQFFEESITARNNILASQIWAESDLIPETAPTLVADATDGVVQYKEDLVLNAVPGTNNSFSHPDLKDAIPFNFGDGSYNYSIKDSLDNPIAFGQGDWLIDSVGGVLTFYGNVPSNMPPKVSFYKYAGTKGISGDEILPNYTESSEILTWGEPSIGPSNTKINYYWDIDPNTNTIVAFDEGPAPDYNTYLRKFTFNPDTLDVVEDESAVVSLGFDYINWIEFIGNNKFAYSLNGVITIVDVSDISTPIDTDNTFGINYPELFSDNINNPEIVGFTNITTIGYFDFTDTSNIIINSIDVEVDRSLSNVDFKSAIVNDDITQAYIPYVETAGIYWDVKLLIYDIDIELGNITYDRTIVLKNSIEFYPSFIDLYHLKETNRLISFSTANLEWEMNVTDLNNDTRILTQPFNSLSNPDIYGYQPFNVFQPISNDEKYLSIIIPYSDQNTNQDLVKIYTFNFDTFDYTITDVSDVFKTYGETFLLEDSFFELPSGRKFVWNEPWPMGSFMELLPDLENTSYSTQDDIIFNNIFVENATINNLDISEITSSSSSLTIQQLNFNNLVNLGDSSTQGNNQNSILVLNSSSSASANNNVFVLTGGSSVNNSQYSIFAGTNNTIDNLSGSIISGGDHTLTNIIRSNISGNNHTLTNVLNSNISGRDHSLTDVSISNISGRGVNNVYDGENTHQYNNIRERFISLFSTLTNSNTDFTFLLPQSETNSIQLETDTLYDCDVKILYKNGADKRVLKSHFSLYNDATKGIIITEHPEIKDLISTPSTSSFDIVIELNRVTEFSYDDNGSSVYYLLDSTYSKNNNFIKLSLTTPYDLSSVNDSVKFDLSVATQNNFKSFILKNSFIYLTNNTSIIYWGEYENTGVDNIISVKDGNQGSVNLSSYGISNINDIDIINNGGYIYVTDDQNVYLFSLSSGYNLSGLSITGNTKIPGINLPSDVYFTDNGLSLFLSDNNYIYRFDTTNAWDFTNVVLHSVHNTTRAVDTFSFNDDGSQIIWADRGGITNYFYATNLTTNYDLSTGTDVYIGDQYGNTAVGFSKSGTFIYLIGQINGNFAEYSVTTAYDVTSGITYVGALYGGNVPYDTNYLSAIYHPNGNAYVYFLYPDGSIRRNDLGTPADLITLGGVAQTYTISNPTSNMGLHISYDGTRVIVAQGETITILTLNTPFDLTTATEYYGLANTLPETLTKSTNSGGKSNIEISNDGLNLLWSDENGIVDHYVLSGVEYLSTATKTSTLDVSTLMNVDDFYFNESNSTIEIYDKELQKIYQYNSATAFDLSTYTQQNNFDQYNDDKFDIVLRHPGLGENTDSKGYLKMIKMT